jgi:hypothetical protein
MITTAILNAVLALGVIVMVVTPLVWAILTQRRDDPRSGATVGASTRPVYRQSSRRGSRPSYGPLTGRA